MKKKIAIWLTALTLYSGVYAPSPARADFWGGDLVFLAQLVANTIQQLAQLRQIFSNGRDTLGLLRDINEGIREAMGIMRTLNTTIKPGVLSQYKRPEDMLRFIEQIYGPVAKTYNTPVEQLTDQSVAEAVTLHNQAFEYADTIDPEAERIKDYSRGVSPVGAGRLTAQSMGVLIHVSNQILRTNAAMLKVLSQNLALQNRHEKANSLQYQVQYEGLSDALNASPKFSTSSKLSTSGRN